MTSLSLPLLGIDYGEKHIGVAMARSSLAEPLMVISTATAIEKLSHLIDDHHIRGLVIGYSEGEMAEKTRNFAALLDGIFRLPYVFQDETLSSYDTRVAVAQHGMPQKKRERKLDHYVAAAILQDYLDSHHLPYT
jgi:putative Holliday junction resolvase